MFDFAMVVLIGHRHSSRAFAVPSIYSENQATSRAFASHFESGKVEAVPGSHGCQARERLWTQTAKASKAKAIARALRQAIPYFVLGSRSLAPVRSFSPIGIEPPSFKDQSSKPVFWLGERGYRVAEISEGFLNYWKPTDLTFLAVVESGLAKPPFQNTNVERLER